jgi:prophage regulatory protein
MKIIRMKAVQEKTSLSRTLIYDKQREGSRYFDPSFPKTVPLGAQSVGFVESEIDEWIEARIRIRASRGGQIASQAAA